MVRFGARVTMVIAVESDEERLSEESMKQKVDKVVAELNADGVIYDAVIEEFILSPTDDQLYEHLEGHPSWRDNRDYTGRR